MSNALMAAQNRRMIQQERENEHRRTDATVARMNEIAQNTQFQRAMLNGITGIRNDNAKAISMLRRMEKQRDREMAKTKHKAMVSIVCGWFDIIAACIAFFALVSAKMVQLSVSIGICSLAIAIGIYITGYNVGVIQYCGFSPRK